MSTAKPPTKPKPGEQIGPIGASGAVIAILAIIVQADRLNVLDNPFLVSLAVGAVVGALLVAIVASAIAERIVPGKRHVPGVVFAATMLLISATAIVGLSVRVGGVQTPEMRRAAQVREQLDTLMQQRQQAGSTRPVTRDETLRLVDALRQAAASTSGETRHRLNVEADMLERITVSLHDYTDLIETPEMQRTLDPKTIAKRSELRHRVARLDEIRTSAQSVLDLMLSSERDAADALVAKGVSRSRARDIAQQMHAGPESAAATVRFRSEIEIIDAIKEMTTILSKHIGKFETDANGELVVDEDFPDEDVRRYNLHAGTIDRLMRNAQNMARTHGGR